MRFSSGLQNISLIAMLFLVSGCAPTTTGAPLTEDGASELIHAALQDIEDIYYRETKASDLVAAGFANVETSTPGVEFVRDDARFRAVHNGQELTSFPVGPDAGASDDWGRNVAETLERVTNTQSEGASLNRLSDAFLRGVTDGLERWSRYAPPEVYDISRAAQRVGRGSVYIVLERSEFGWQIGSVNNASLRESGTLRKGDLLTHIDGNPIDHLTVVEVFEHISGKIGSNVELTIRRVGDSTPLRVTVQREERGGGTVLVMPEGNSFRIVITVLSSSTVDELRYKFGVRKASPSEAGGIILDLRSSPGGLLESAVAMVNAFLDRGPIFSSQGRHPESHQNFKADGGQFTYEQPLVILVKQGTGSGSEIIAAALQDNRRAIVVGEPSFGLGTIRTTTPLPNFGFLDLTWAEVLTPAGYRLDKRGVMPTVCTGGNVSVEEVLAALRSGGGVIDYTTRTRDIDPEDTAAVEAFRALCPPREDGGDISLEVARALLDDPALYDAVLERAGRATETAAR